MITYDQIKQLANEEGVPVADLIALARQNDPFYCGSRGQRGAGSYYDPKTTEPEEVERVEPVAVSAADKPLTAVERPTPHRTEAHRLKIFPTILRIIRVFLYDAPCPLPRVAGHVQQSVRTGPLGVAPHRRGIPPPAWYPPCRLLDYYTASRPTGCPRDRCAHRYPAAPVCTPGLQPAFLPHRPAAHRQPTRCAKWPLKPPATPCNPHPQALSHYTCSPFLVSPSSVVVCEILPLRNPPPCPPPSPT
jgi:hypothetical protein